MNQFLHQSTISRAMKHVIFCRKWWKYSRFVLLGKPTFFIQYKILLDYSVKNSLLFGYSLLSILFEKTKEQDGFTRVWYKSNFVKFLFVEDILHVDIYHMSPKRARAPTSWGVGRFAAFYKIYELFAAFDYDNWHYAIDEYCNFVIVVKSGFCSEKNHSWCHSIFVKTFEKLP